MTISNKNQEPYDKPGYGNMLLRYIERAATHYGNFERQKFIADVEMLMTLSPAKTRKKVKHDTENEFKENENLLSFDNTLAKNKMMFEKLRDELDDILLKTSFTYGGGYSIEEE